MELNSIIFRPPVPSYTYSRFGTELLWVPKDDKQFIPCLFLRSHQPSNKIFLFFHANAEDLGKVYDFLDIIRCVLEISVFAPEYPGYGLYKGSTNCKKILKDTQVIYTFIQQVLKIPQENIIIIGRSIGTGPASYLAGFTCNSLILLSPYTSLRLLIKSLAGSFMQYLVKDQLKNIEYLKKVTCPVLLIHGKKDGLIPYKHSEQLASVCAGSVTIFLSETMTHNKFEYYEDVISPIDKFFRENNIELHPTEPVQVPAEYLNTPSYIKLQNEILSDFL